MMLTKAEYERLQSLVRNGDVPDWFPPVSEDDLESLRDAIGPEAENGLFSEEEVQEMCQHLMMRIKLAERRQREAQINQPTSKLDGQFDNAIVDLTGTSEGELSSSMSMLGSVIRQGRKMSDVKTSSSASGSMALSHSTESVETEDRKQLVSLLKFFSEESLNSAAAWVGTELVLSRTETNPAQYFAELSSARSVNCEDANVRVQLVDGDGRSGEVLFNPEGISSEPDDVYRRFEGDKLSSNWDELEIIVSIEQTNRS